MESLPYRKVLFLIAGILISNYLSAANYYVAANGNDTAPGTMGQPFGTVAKAVSMVAPGDTVFVRGGTYPLSATISISKSGTVNSYCTLKAFPGERPILDFSSQALSGSNRGIKLTGSYWNIEGIDITGAGDNGLKIEGGSYNEIVNCAFYRNRDSGVQIGSGSSYNRVINCDSYYNADPPDYGDADGFAAKLDVGVENYFYGCRAWLNCDDGWDGYLRGADNVSTIIDNCWAFENGYLEDGTDPGPSANGNGFKMGGSDDKLLRHDYILTNCLAFKNKAKGFDQNSNKGSMTLYNCTGHNNLVANYRITTTLAVGEELVIKNSLELGDLIDLGAFAKQETNSWMEAFIVTDDDFISLNDSEAYGPRQADGSLPEISYMHLSEESDLIDVGVNVGLPYYGDAPDLGCFEVFVPSISVYNSLSPTFTLYPNPAHDELWIIPGEKFAGDLTISLHDIIGRQVMATELRGHSSQEFMLDLTGIESGIYLVTLRIGNIRSSELLEVR